MNKGFMRTISFTLSLVLLSCFFFALPASAWTGRNLITNITSFSHDGTKSVSETVNNQMNPMTNKEHYMNTWRITVSVDSDITSLAITLEGQTINPADITTTYTTSGSYRIYTVTVQNVQDYINPNAWLNAIKFVTSKGSLSSQNSLFVQTLPDTPSFIGYDSTRHWVTGFTTGLEYRRYTTTWNSWSEWTSTAVNLNVYSILSTSRETIYEVRYKSGAMGPNPSEAITITIPALEAAPSGLYINWYNSKPVLWGLQAGQYYACSLTSNFSSFATYTTTTTGQYLTPALTVNAGDTVYVRTAQDNTSASSAYVALTVPNQSKSASTPLDTFGLELIMEDVEAIVEPEMSTYTCDLSE